MDPSNTIQQIRAGDESTLRDIYQDHRDEFVNWVQVQYRVSGSDAKELFQLAVVTLYDNVMTGKLTQLTGSLKTYVFAIGKNKARDLQRKGLKVQSMSDAFIYDRPVEEVSIYKEEREQLFGEVERGLRQLGASCRELLTLFYHQRLSMQDICVRLDYSNAATAKNMKYKCLQRLKKLVGIPKPEAKRKDW